MYHITVGERSRRGEGLLCGDGCEAGRRECLTQTNAELFPFAFGAESKRCIIDTVLTHISRQLSCGACFYSSSPSPSSTLPSLRLKHSSSHSFLNVLSAALADQCHPPSLNAPTVSKGGSKVASSITSPTQEIQEAPGIFPDWVTFLALFVCFFGGKISFLYIFFLDMVVGRTRLRAGL